MSMTLKQLTAEYQKIADFINQHWPLKNKEQRIFARTMKVVEELGELADEILTSMNLQRKSKIAKFSQENVEDELADVMASIILLASELKIDLDKIMKKKIQYTRERFEIN
ncbi:MazG-like family protein [Patescibacteria group bacterium]|nr:MazG-like family protein [Patescibacteria group bacterium]MBU1966952.1 MazG-like family protein [Patescibacteria group bacterium]MBU2543299.1 MazG-like family protein [Patescibacteria group bacterium]